jgi:tripartite-type tricarboxylate transporter receptor subunit TctC
LFSALHIAIAILFCAASGGAVAADSSYPTRPIRWVVATAPGGGVDATARILAPKLSEQMGETWIVDNRAGAAGNVGVEIVARSSPDGYTLLAATSTVLTVNPSLYKMPVNIEKDLQPITTLAAAEQAVIVHPSVPARTLKELIALARQNPGALNYASAGTGTALHLGAELLKLRTGISMTHVPYKGGGPAFTALVGGEVHIMFVASQTATSLLKSGKLRVLGVSTAKRSQLLPAVPTIAEAGVPGYEVNSWSALFVPAGTPATIVKSLNTEVSKGLKQPDAAEVLEKQGLEYSSGAPEEVAAMIRSEVAKWTKVIKTMGIKP